MSTVLTKEYTLFFIFFIPLADEYFTRISYISNELNFFLQVLSALDVLQPPHVDYFQEM